MSFYITTPIYYVNARPHLGHAYTTIVADAMARFHRMKGENVYFLTGTDEHGDKIVKAAAADGKEPKAFVDGISGEFKALWPKLNITNNDFIRTTDERHKRAVQALLQRIYDKGDIYFGEYGGHYCFGCERFYTEKELENGLCPQHQTKPEFISEKNYFFKMSKYQGWLKEHIEKNPDFIRPERYKNEVLALLEGGELEDLCISRPKSRLTWGIELPFDTNYVCYVWFDALTNYLTALGWPDAEQEPNSLYQQFWPSVQHLVAKDILKPHGVFWPTMLKAADLPIYTHLNVHGYWLVRDAKMSKSLGNVIDPLQTAQTVGLDAFRYFLLREMNFGSDASVYEEALYQRINADLANDLGNLFSRVLSMNAKYFASTIPPLGDQEAEDENLSVLTLEAAANFLHLFENARFSQALDALWEPVRAMNKYVDTMAPWTLYKEEKTERLGTVIRTLLECMYTVAWFVWPVMPTASEAMQAQLGRAAKPEATRFSPAYLKDMLDCRIHLRTGTVIEGASNLFPRLEMPAKEEKKPAKTEAKAAKELASQAAPQAAEKVQADQAASQMSQVGQAGQAEQAERAGHVEQAKAPAKALIEYPDFEKLDIRVGKVLVAEKHPNADSLLRLEVDLGEEKPRQIISGIARFFAPENLVGQNVLVVANLAPRKLRGLESQGMVLTAEHGDALALCTAAAVAGSVVK